jgi:hypothetical protein
MTSRSVKAKKKKKRGVTQSNSAQMRTALECAKVGLRVAPMHGRKKRLCTCGDKDCKRAGQHLRTPNGIADATSKPEDIKEFWSQYPKAKIAVATGVAGMIALKVTGDVAQAAISEDLAAQSTVEIIDGNSRIFLWKTLVENIPDGSVKLEKGVTVLGRNKFIIAPNELDASEGARRFASGPNQVDIAQAPDWLLGRLRPRLLGIDTVGVSAGSNGVRFKTATIDVKSIIDWNRPCDPAEIKLRARSISETGPRMPPAVRLLDGETPRYVVLTDRCQVEALKSLGATAIRCVVVDADEDGALVWQVAELFNQPHKTTLERAELAMKCVEILRRKGGQHAQGSKQPNDKGMSAAERVLSVSRRDLGRFEKINAISAEAKKQVRLAGLDDNQNALLAIAELPTEKQAEKVRELADQYSEGRRKRSAAANSTTPPTVSTDNDEDDADEPEDGADNERHTPPDKGSEEDAFHGEGDADEPEAGAESPPTVPDGEELDISPDHVRKRDEKKLQTLKAIYAEHLEPEWNDASPEVQLEYVIDVLGVSAGAIAHAEVVDFVIKAIDNRSWIYASELYADTDAHGFKRKDIRGALAYLRYRLWKKGRINQLSWIYKAIDKDRVPYSMHELDDSDLSDDDYYNS